MNFHCFHLFSAKNCYAWNTVLFAYSKINYFLRILYDEEVLPSSKSWSYIICISVFNTQDCFQIAAKIFYVIFSIIIFSDIIIL